jgi:hypothetical protein
MASSAAPARFRAATDQDAPALLSMMRQLCSLMTKPFQRKQDGPW